MSTILSLSRSSSYSLSSQVVRRGTVHRRNLHRGHARLVQPEQNYSDYTTSTDSSAYVTAATHLDESSTSHVSVDECILQAIDTSSGAAFDTIHLRSLGEIDLHSLDLGAQRTDSTYPPVTRNSWSSQIPPWKIGQDVQVSEIPTLILTEPTPMIPQSPVFIPQSPITVQQFFSAAASTGPRRVPAETKLRRPGPTHTSPSGYLAPSLTSCSDCGLVEFDQGLQCQKCNRRRLACKVWYDRATDGGQRRRWLTEPYIRPGKCNETNREIPTTRDLTIFGYPAALCSSDYRLGRTPDAPYPRQRIVWDIWKTIKRRLVQARQKLAIQRSVSSVRQTLDASAKPLRHHLRSPVPFKPVVV
ncbi:hypothetical protein BC835DRAFT_342197 [Cytidiella melzeri]|nr:hypothetical protein BC835DRAFT_342197 [Cytidiella melzeri]